MIYVYILCDEMRKNVHRILSKYFIGIIENSVYCILNTYDDVYALSFNIMASIYESLLDF